MKISIRYTYKDKIEVIDVSSYSGWGRFPNMQDIGQVEDVIKAVVAVFGF